MNSKYPIHSLEGLEKFLQKYVREVLRVGKIVGLDLTQQDFSPDHLGLQVLNAEEFNTAHATLSQYCKLVHNETIHGRRNYVYRFKAPLKAHFAGIEIFEPKPDTDPTTLRPGIEHVAFVSTDLHKLQAKLQEKGLIAKDATYSRGRFIKTKLIDGIEIEFRDKTLI